MENDNKKNKFLIALDGSDYSSEAVKYIKNFEQCKNMDIILFNVYSPLPEYYFDANIVPEYDEVVSWELDHINFIRKYMGDVHDLFVKSGFERDGIKIKINKRKVGFARDILIEAKNDYSFIVIGRKGIGELNEIFLGSIAAKVFEKLFFTPIFIVGKNPNTDKILVAVDGSENSMRAVDFICKVFNNSDIKIGLIHIIRGGSTKENGVKKIFSKRNFIENTKDAIIPFIEKAKNNLINYGINANNIDVDIITNVTSRAAAIFEYAKKNNYGTIVAGRRGLSVVTDFFAGRVVNKIVQLANDRSVWIIP
ncbi:MAG: universal stress protein [Desulfobacterales bacterium]|nr:universal stress protein [Desulfobacterales bacterium]